MKLGINTFIKPFSSTSEAGMTLTSVLVSLAVLGVFVVMSSQSFKNLQSAARRVEASSAVRDIESLTIQALSDRFKSYVLVDRCTTAPSLYFSNISLGEMGSLSMSPIVFRNRKGSATEAPPEAHKDLARCSSTPFSRAPTLTGTATFYACFNVTTNATAAAQAAAGTFAANRGAFVEFFVNLRDLRTDSLVPCNLISGKGYGLESFYYMHWATQTPTSVIYDSKIGTINAAL